MDKSEISLVNEWAQLKPLNDLVIDGKLNLSWSTC